MRRRFSSENSGGRCNIFYFDWSPVEQRAIQFITRRKPVIRLPYSLPRYHRSQARGITDSRWGPGAFHGLSSPPESDVESWVATLRATNRFFCPIVIGVRAHLTYAHGHIVVVVERVANKSVNVTKRAPHEAHTELFDNPCVRAPTRSPARRSYKPRELPLCTSVKVGGEGLHLSADRIRRIASRIVMPRRRIREFIKQSCGCLRGAVVCLLCTVDESNKSASWAAMTIKAHAFFHCCNLRAHLQC